MAYTKELIGNVTKGANHKRGEKRCQYIADKVDENLAEIEEAIPVIGSGAINAAAGNHNHDAAYQVKFAASTTLTQLGITPPTGGSAWAGTAMHALTGASTFQQLLDAIATDIATAATLPSAG